MTGGGDLGPYAGMQPGTLSPAETPPHVLVTGPTGAGKTFRVLGPAVRMWSGPVVAVSSKADLLAMTGGGRARGGPVYVLDLGGNVRLPEGAIRVRVDPVISLTSEDEALDLATLLMRVGGVGATGSASLGGGAEATLWQSQAAAPLAALLWAYRHDGMESVVRAVGRHEPDAGPCWPDALMREPDSLLSAALEALSQQDSRQRSSVVITMTQGLTPWTRSTVRGDGLHTLTPDMLTPGPDGRPTLYVVSPVTGIAAGAAVALLSQIVAAWRTDTEAGRDPARVLFAIDEMANTAPMPDLPVWVTEARGLGVSILGAVQTTDQLALRWGDAAGTVLRRTFPAVLALRGAAERQLFEDAVLWGGRSERTRTTTGEDGSLRMQSTEVEARFTPEQLVPGSVRQGRLLPAGSVGSMVDLPTYVELGQAHRRGELSR